MAEASWRQQQQQQQRELITVEGQSAFGQLNKDLKATSKHDAIFLSLKNKLKIK